MARDDTPRHVPGSDAVYTTAQVNDQFVAPDWHPQEHSPAPSIVAIGRPPDVYPCGHCHRMTGSGGPENAPLSGLSADYIVQQLEDFRQGRRSTAVAHRAPQTNMIHDAKALTPAEIQAAARYFSALVPRRTVRVVEAAQVPRTRVEGWRLAFMKGSDREDIGDRIVEVPDVPADFESRDSHATFTAYVPPGSLARGRVLAKSCSVCHGPRLAGLGPAPPIAGRSPTYLFRQLYEIQAGIRAGTAVAPMRAVIATFAPDDLIAVAAWSASLQ